MLVCRANISNSNDYISNKSFVVCHITLARFDLSSDSSDSNLLDAYKVKTFIAQSPPLPDSLFEEGFFNMSFIPMMVLKYIADLYRCKAPDTPFIRV